MSCDPPLTEEERESCVICIAVIARHLLNMVWPLRLQQYSASVFTVYFPPLSIRVTMEQWRHYLNQQRNIWSLMANHIMYIHAHCVLTRMLSTLCSGLVTVPVCGGGRIWLVCSKWWCRRCQETPVPAEASGSAECHAQVPKCLTSSEPLESWTWCVCGVHRSAILCAAEANYTEAQKLARQLVKNSQPQLKRRFVSSQ